MSTRRASGSSSRNSHNSRNNRPQFHCDLQTGKMENVNGIDLNKSGGEHVRIGQESAFRKRKMTKIAEEEGRRRNTNNSSDPRADKKKIVKRVSSAAETARNQAAVQITEEAVRARYVSNIVAKAARDKLHNQYHSKY